VARREVPYHLSGGYREVFLNDLGGLCKSSAVQIDRGVTVDSFPAAAPEVTLDER